MTGTYKLWTDHEKQVVKKHYQDGGVSVAEISEMTGKSEHKVRCMARHLGLKRPIPDVEGTT
jgi:predicted transcriptional regulator